ncbi:MAG: RNA methyltransferase [Eubacterium aggregans]|uniref:RNA methyltransferase, TrmH family n=2 Tax=Eubacterium aggregans TaxID=81409 RepID=A0A1H4EB86_9FIRM|nr:RNA methyltransferase [Eubacterium aggregans]MEA5074361.1 RNA methyltransferase [Eubacterium aggregans]SEA82304.1 RNA methyltransferase, TrmH family [Eubacterium aggregans]
MPGSITSCSNSRVKSICALQRKRIRDTEDAFIFEGIKLFREALAWDVPITDIFITPSLLQILEEDGLNRNLQSKGVETWVVDDAVMQKISLQKNPEGVLCRCQKMENKEQDLPSYVIFEDIQDPGNVGTLIRTADAAGFGGIITTESTADIYNDKVLRSSMGSVFHLPIVQNVSLDNILLTLKQSGYTIIGTALEGNENFDIKDYQTFKPVIILGNESKGMKDNTKAQCDHLLRLPMYGPAESLNVSVAGGIVLYDIARKVNKGR